MSSEEDRVRRYEQRVKDRYHDDNDFKGAFSKGKTKAKNTRKRMNPREVDMYYDDEQD